MQGAGHEIEDLLVPEPGRGLVVDLPSARLKNEEMAAVFQSSDVGVQRLPFVGDERNFAGGRELAGDFEPLKRSRIGMPVDTLDDFRLAKRFQQAYAISVLVETIHVIQHDRLVSLEICLLIDAKSAGVSINPANGRAHGAAYASA